MPFWRKVGIKDIKNSNKCVSKYENKYAYVPPLLRIQQLNTDLPSYVSPN